MNKLDRPSWDTYFMTLCFLVAQRSIDKSTKHGCIVTSYDHTLLSVGYNSPPRGFDDKNCPQERPIKYEFMVHSETNAINNAARHGISLKDSIFYVTGFTCPSCFRNIINVGAKKIIYGPVGSHCVTNETKDIVKRLNSNNQIELIEYKIHNNKTNPKFLLERTTEYFNNKITEKI